MRKGFYQAVLVISCLLVLLSLSASKAKRPERWKD